MAAVCNQQWCRVCWWLSRNYLLLFLAAYCAMLPELFSNLAIILSDFPFWFGIFKCHFETDVCWTTLDDSRLFSSHCVFSLYPVLVV